MIQRSKDAKDLSAMRHIKDKTVQVGVRLSGCGFCGWVWTTRRSLVGSTSRLEQR